MSSWMHNALERINKVISHVDQMVENVEKVDELLAEYPIWYSFCCDNNIDSDFGSFLLDSGFHFSRYGLVREDFKNVEFKLGFDIESWCVTSNHTILFWLKIDKGRIIKRAGNN